MSEIVEQIKAMGTDLKSEIAKANEQAVKAGQVAEDTKNNVANLSEKLQEAKDQLAKQQGDIDGMATKLARSGGLVDLDGMPLGLKAQLEKQMGNGAMDAYRTAKLKANAPSFELNTKAVGNLASATSLTGSYFVPAMQAPGVYMGTEFNPNHVRQYLTTGSTSSNTIRYIVDNGGEGAPGMVAEGGLKPQVDRDLEIKDAPVRKIGEHMRVPEEMIEDIPYLAGHLTTVGIELLDTLEDSQVLYGSGSGQNLTGLTVVASAFAAGSLVVGATANVYDVLVAARLQIRKKQYMATAVMISPLDYAKLSLLKDTTGQYLFPETRTGGIPRIAGVPIVENTAITEGDFLIGDFVRGAALLNRASTSVRFYDQDQDNAVKNLVTIVIEKRIALPIYRPQAFVYGTFATAITDLAS